MGDVYTSQIANEQAVHALEHGAVWITYKPDLPQDQIDKLASRVRDVEFTMMSPYPGLDSAISLQAWGYQLKVDNANDGRIDEFISALRKNARTQGRLQRRHHRHRYDAVQPRRRDATSDATPARRVPRDGTSGPCGRVVRDARLRSWRGHALRREIDDRQPAARAAGSVSASSPR